MTPAGRPYGGALVRFQQWLGGSRQFGRKLPLVGHQVAVESRRTSDRLAGIVQDEVEPRQCLTKMIRKGFNARRVSQIDAVNLKSCRPVGTVVFGRETRGGISRKSSCHNDLATSSQKLQRCVIPDFDSATREQSKATRQIERPLPTLPVQFGTARTKGVVEKMDAIEILFADVTAPRNAQAINEVFVFRIDCLWRRFCFEGSRRTRLFQLPRAQLISDSRASQELFVFRLLLRNRGLLTLFERPHQSFSRLAIRAGDAFGRLHQPTTVVTRKPSE